MPTHDLLIIDLMAREFAAHAHAPLGANGQDAWVFDVDSGHMPTCVMAFSKVATLAAPDRAEGAEHRGG